MIKIQAKEEPDRFGNYNLLLIKNLRGLKLDKELPLRPICFN